MDSPRQNAISEPKVVEDLPELPAQDAVGEEGPPAPGTPRGRGYVKDVMSSLSRERLKLVAGTMGGPNSPGVSYSTRAPDMRGVRRAVSAAAVMTAAALLTASLAACGGTAGSEAEPPAGSPARGDKATTSASAVRSDIRAAAAAGDFAPPKFPYSARKVGPCAVIAQIRTAAKPERKAVDAVVAELKARGWRAAHQSADPLGHSWTLEKAEWSLLVLSGRMSKAQVAAAQPELAEEQTRAIAGVFLSGLVLNCHAGASQPPSADGPAG